MAGEPSGNSQPKRLLLRLLAEEASVVLKEGRTLLEVGLPILIIPFRVPLEIGVGGRNNGARLRAEVFDHWASDSPI